MTVTRRIQPSAAPSSVDMINRPCREDIFQQTYEPALGVEA